MLRWRSVGVGSILRLGRMDLALTHVTPVATHLLQIAPLGVDRSSTVDRSTIVPRRLFGHSVIQIVWSVFRLLVACGKCDAAFPSHASSLLRSSSQPTTPSRPARTNLTPMKKTNGKCLALVASTDLMPSTFAQSGADSKQRMASSSQPASLYNVLDPGRWWSTRNCLVDGVEGSGVAD